MNSQSNSFIQVTVSEDKLFGYLQFANVPDMFSVTIEQLHEALKQKNITHGVDVAQLANIAGDPKPYLYTRTVVARGTKATDGRNGSIRYLFDIQSGVKKPQELEDGKVDYKELLTLNNVKKGQLIGQRFPATEGMPGKSVTGEMLLPVVGKEARFKIGKNVYTDPENMALYAAIDGMVSKTDRDKVNVFPVFEVNGDVDYSVGNIEFVGTVVIRGNVSPGFRVRAYGDIRVTGGVEAAELEADGSIEISAGVLGQNKAKLKAGLDIKSSFIQDAHIESGGSVLVSQSIMHSTIRARNAVICRGTKGLIVGGTIQAGERVTCRTIGNAMSTTTTIEIGVLPELRNELQQLRIRLKTSMENLDKTNKALALLDQIAMSGQLTGEKIAMRTKLSQTKTQVTAEQAEVRERIFELERMLEDTERAKVEVLSIIYGGVKIVIGRYTKYIKDPLSHCTFQLSDGDITVLPYA